MRYSYIFYQLDKDASVYKRFAGWDELQRIGKFDWKDYKVVYAGTVEAANETDACETLYQKFNVGKKTIVLSRNKHERERHCKADGRKQAVYAVVL